MTTKLSYYQIIIHLVNSKSMGETVREIFPPHTDIQTISQYFFLEIHFVWISMVFEDWRHRTKEISFVEESFLIFPLESPELGTAFSVAKPASYLKGLNKIVALFLLSKRTKFKLDFKIDIQ